MQARLTCLLRHLAVLLWCAAAAANLVGDPAFPRLMLNADTLLPASFAWDLLHVPGAWANHQVARIPSVVPDMAGMVALFAATGSAAASLALYAAAQLALMAYAGGWLVARVAAVRPLTGSMAVAAMFGLVTLTGAADASTMAFALALPVVHVGPLILGLAGIAAAIALSDGAWSRTDALVLGAAGTAVFLDDLLLLVTFAAPLVLLAASRRHAVRRLAVPLGAGMGLGLAGLLLLRLSGLRTESPLPVRPLRFPAHAAAFLHDLPALLLPVTLHEAACAGLLAAAVVLPPLLRMPRLRLAWLVGVASMAGSVVFAACFYEDTDSKRYMLPLLAWPSVLVASLLARSPRLAWAAWATATAAALLAVPLSGRDPLRLRIPSPVAACLASLQTSHGLHAGLADFWTARPAELALGWAVQVDQVTARGLPDPWGTDRSWIHRDIHAPGRPPVRDFIVMRNLDPAAIAAHFGPPDAVADCDGVPVWTYAPGHDLQPILDAPG